MNIKTLNALANFAILTTSKKIMARAIRVDVVRIAEAGVINFGLIPAKYPGNKPSFDIAKGNLEEAKTPEFAIDIRVKTPTTPAIRPKVSPPIV